MHRLALSLSLAIFAACGSGSSSTPRTTPTPDPDTTASPATADDGHTDHTHQDPPTTDAPSEPAQPAQPAPPDPAQVKADLLAAEMAAFEKAKPVFDKNCSSCHVMGGKGAKKKMLEHFNMTKYPFGGHHAGEITASIRKSLGLTGGKATMPKKKPGSVQGDDLAVIAAWADAFDASMAGGAHAGMAGHDHGGGHKH